MFHSKNLNPIVMKRSGYLLTGVLLLAALGCQGQSGSSGNNEVAGNSTQALAKSGPAASDGTPVSIGKAEFLKLIMDYEKNPETWVYRGEIPCIVDFYADWCAPCRITSPILEELAVEFSGKINVYKVNIDKERELAAIFGVQSIPTFLYCPMEGNPTISAGIANTPDATRDMFRDNIQQILLKKSSSSPL